MTGAKNQPSKEKLGKLLEAGFDLIPLHQAHAVSASGKPMGKRPLGNDWLRKKPLTLSTLMTYMLEGHNVGVRLPAWCVVVDIDPRNFAIEGETSSKTGELLDVRPDQKLERDFGFSLADYPTVLTGSYFPNKDPSTGMHVYMRVPEGFLGEGQKLRKALEGYKGIDFKWLGGQVVAPGSVHPDTNRYYEWDTLLEADITDLPDAPPKLLEALRKEALGGKVQAGFQAVTPEQLEATLDQMDVEEFRDQEKWQEFMMACHAATQGEGVNEFVAWSTSDPMYAHAGSDVAYRWESLDANAPGGITHLSFRKIADDHGAHVPMASDEFAELDEEEVEADSSAESGPQPTNPLKELNSKFFCAMEAGKFVVFTEENDAALHRRVLTRMTVRDFQLRLADRKIEVGNKVKPLAQVWLEWPGRNFFDSVQFLPQYGDDRYPTIDGDRVFNLWRGFNVEPDGGATCDALYELIRETLADGREDVERYILDWMAYAVQHPEKPAEVAVIFRGGKGTGKGTLGRAFFQMFSPHGLHITSPGLLTGRFNDHLRDTVALFADEAFWAGDKQGESVLKGLVTEPMITFEGKGTNAAQGRNCLHIMMASNLDWVVPAGSDGERRFAVFDVNKRYVGDSDFFTRLNDELYGRGEFEGNSGLARLLHDLKARDIDGWHPRESIPRTSALAEQMRIGYSPIENFLFSALADGDAELWRPYRDDWSDGGGVEVLCKEFYEAFRQYALKQLNARLYPRELSDNAIGMGVSKIFGPVVDKVRLTKPPEGYDGLVGGRPYAYVFSDLELLRQVWEERQGSKIDWTSAF